MQSIKEHNLKANHNWSVIALRLYHSVCNLSKNTIWKQITTYRFECGHWCTLYAIYQRTQSESKSQHERCNVKRKQFCMQSIKEHNLKANHNPKREGSPWHRSVCNLSKNTIWKQITTAMAKKRIKGRLYAIYQRTQSESKSQLASANASSCASVCNLSKNTIWKQITTNSAVMFTTSPLYAIYQRTQSESKSQPRFGIVSVNPICMQSIKEHNLKANHNTWPSTMLSCNSVCNLSKNTIWKQITTQFGQLPR